MSADLIERAERIVEASFLTGEFRRCGISEEEIARLLDPYLDFDKTFAWVPYSPFRECSRCGCTQERHSMWVEEKAWEGYGPCPRWQP